MDVCFRYDSDQNFVSLYKFTGKERDAESGLDYFGARYFRSNMGRWMSPDWSTKEEPVPYAKLGDPQSLNLYAYVLNSPLVQKDPDGHCCESDFNSFSDHPGRFKGGYDPMDKKFAQTMFSLSAVAIPEVAIISAGHNIAQGNYKAALLDAASVIPAEKAVGSVWKLGNFARGMAIERLLGGNLPRAFPVIDRFAGGVATSIKSLDLGANTYQNADKLVSVIERYIDKVAAFSGARYAGREIKASEITVRELHLAVPGPGTAEQQSALKAASKYANKANVKLTITQVQ